LTLIPTPIDEDSPLETVALEALKKASQDLEKGKALIVIEDLKPGRRRWLKWGLPRSVVESFTLYNEHTRKEALGNLIQFLNKGGDVYLMSDGGLPAFYDPGVELVDQCHVNKIKVTSTPFCNSISLALALSGLDHQQFYFGGILPRKSEDRGPFLKELLNQKMTTIVLDTPYRLKKTLEELKGVWGKSKASKKLAFLALDLNRDSEELFRGNPDSLMRNVGEFKREFILVIGSPPNA
jgi:16S rRNA (cytidine1402-2'-O)-methyltransferase